MAGFPRPRRLFSPKVPEAHLAIVVRAARIDRGWTALPAWRSKKSTIPPSPVLDHALVVGKPMEWLNPILRPPAKPPRDGGGGPSRASSTASR